MLGYRRHQFHRAADTYHSHSEVHRALAVDFLKWVDMPSKGDRVLELGCGTGNTSIGLLRKGWREAVFTDSSPNMLRICRHHIGESGLPLTGTHFAVLDAEMIGNHELPLREDCFSLVVSSALVQWFPLLYPHFEKVRHVLKPGGKYLLASFTNENFPELRELLSSPPFLQPPLPGHSLAALEAQAREAGFEPELSRDWKWCQSFRTASDFFRMVHDIGASRKPGPRGPLPPRKLRLLMDTYQERFRFGKGVIATWHAALLQLRLP